jgi:hypothetical protein
MAQKIAGVAHLTVDNVQVALRGNFTISHSMVERTMLAGQDGIHGYQELPRVPYIEADISTVPNFDIRVLDNQTDITVVAQLANGWYWQMSDAICKAGLEQNTRDGQARVRWEGYAVNAWQGTPADIQIPQVVGPNAVAAAAG